MLPYWISFLGEVGSTSTITLPKKLELESQVYSPFGGNLDTGRGPQTAGGSTGHWPESATRGPKGIVPGNGTVSWLYCHYVKAVR